MVSCGNGHFYNDAEHSACPFCGVGLELTLTRPAAGETKVQPAAGSVHTRAAGTPPAGLGRDAGETRHIWAKRLGGIDPVVGWLVCVEGPDRGRDYRIHSERNYIGRAPTMDIAVTGDAAVSRDNHAVLSYDPRRRNFRLAPGESRGIVYLNDEEVVAATELKPYDRIELGETKLLFVPFCGEQFVWSATEAPGNAP